MTPRKLLWLLPLLLYVAFAFWYTNTRGALTAEEIRSFTHKAAEAGFQPDWLEPIHEFMSSDTGRQFFMVNAIDLNENPPDVEGAKPGETAPQLLGRYMEYMYPAMLRRASHPVFIAPAVSRSLDIVGIEGAEDWDLLVVMRYRSRRDLLEVVTNPVFLDRHDMKIAALTKTIAYPTESKLYMSDVRFLLALILGAVVALIDIAVFGRRRSRRRTIS